MQVPLGVGAVTWRLLRAGAEPAGGVLPKCCCLLGLFVGTSLVCFSGVRGKSGKRITFTVTGCREKCVVIHRMGSLLLKAVKVHPLGSPEDTVLW